MIALSLFALAAQAGVTTTISAIEAPQLNGESYEVLAGDGRVYEIDPRNERLINELRDAEKSGTRVALELEEGIPFDSNLPERVRSVKALEIPSPSPESDPGQELDPMTDFEPNDVESLDLADEMFGALKKRSKWFTQCFNRAHIWARQMHKDYGVKSQKILIYYTKKYRREVSKKWWFHIAPMITVNGEKYVMDREFTNQPVTDESWESIFTKKMKKKNIGPRNYRCAQIKNISEYYDEANMNNEYCNIQLTSMYYWEPNDMEKLEEKGIQKTNWVNWELKAAAKEVWWGWRDIYKNYKVQE